MSANDKFESNRPSKDSAGQEGVGRGRNSSAAAPGELSKALRSVYDKALREDVPDDFMDLLGKLS